MGNSSVKLSEQETSNDKQLNNVESTEERGDRKRKHCTTTS